MAMSPIHPPKWTIERHGSEVRLGLSGDWIARETGAWNLAGVRQVVAVHEVLNDTHATRLGIDTTAIGRWDSALIVFIQTLRAAIDESQSGRIELDLSGLPQTARRLLALADSGGPDGDAPLPPPPTLPTRVGLSAFGSWNEMKALATLVGETALRGASFFAGRAKTRIVDVIALMAEAGAGALGIVAVVNGLVGAILAFVGAVQLRRFGADIYVADLVGIAVVREMAAVMTAIVMAGRTGGAYAAHLATMQGNEEIDALKALGIPIYDFLVLPRMAALVTMMPLLYLYACAVGLLGGFVVSIATLDLSATAFWAHIQIALAGRQFAIGLVKSIAFGALVALAGCHIGLKAGRSAADVGHAATAAVVAGIVGVIALDAVFAVCANALGI